MRLEGRSSEEEVLPAHFTARYTMLQFRPPYEAPHTLGACTWSIEWSRVQRVRYTSDTDKGYGVIV